MNKDGHIGVEGIKVCMRLMFFIALEVELGK